jgi:hypothetical protein
VTNVPTDQGDEINTYWGFVFDDGSVWTDDLFGTKEQAERFLKHPDAEFIEGGTLTELVIRPAASAHSASRDR